MTPTDSPESDPDNARLVRWLIASYVRPHARKLVLAALCMAVTAGAAAIIAWLVQPIMDTAVDGSDKAMLYQVALALFAVMTVNGVAIYGHSVLLASAGQRIVADMQVTLFRKFMDADLSYLDDHHSGQFIARCLNDTARVGAMISGAVLSLARDSLMFLLLAGVMVYRDWQLSLIMLMIFPLVGVGIGRIGRMAAEATRGVLVQVARITTVLSEALGGARLVKAYGAEGHETARARNEIEQWRLWSVRAARAQALVSPLTEFLGGAAVALTVFYGVWRFETGQFTIGGLASFLAAMALAYRPLKRLLHINVAIREGLVAAQRVREVLDIRPSIVDAPGAAVLSSPRGEIRFDTVSFAYGNGVPVIHAIDLVVPTGRTVALVGPSGAGKSTLVNLIPRLYDVGSGRILLDGLDLREITLSSLRSAIALVTQETVLFDDTVRANIAYGRRDASDAEIFAAARAALAEDFILDLPDGYDTVVGERGLRLSGGQRQRVAIARAMLKDAPILLLDEPTSSLDNESERSVKLALGRLVEGRTTLIVAHRLSTVSDAQEIHVMDQGRIVESGRHHELLARGGTYARLYALQSAEDSAHDAAGAAAPPLAAVAAGTGD